MLASVAAGLLLPAAAASAPEYPKLFGTTEIRSANLAAFPKWTGVLERYFHELDLPAGDCEDADFNQCHLTYWGRFVDNQIEDIIRADYILHYRPYYSINEDGWWLHRT